MTKPSVLVFSGYGLNCENETLTAFKLAGAKGKIVHLNEIISRPSQLDRHQILALPGGFCYGDDTGSGNAFAHRIKNNFWKHLTKFINKDNLIIGICNGFQILVRLGIVPALGQNYGHQQTALINNSNARYTDRWIDLKITSNSPWLRDIDTISLPIAHGEGRFYTDSKTLSQLKKSRQIAARYTSGKICNHFNLPANPNGSLKNIAAITNKTGTILGMMPHPERAIFFTQLPHWTKLKQEYHQTKNPLPDYGPGLKLFKNSISYFS